MSKFLDLPYTNRTDSGQGNVVDDSPYFVVSLVKSRIPSSSRGEDVLCISILRESVSFSQFNDLSVVVIISSISFFFVFPFFLFFFLFTYFLSLSFFFVSLVHKIIIKVTKRCFVY